jgi:preprotein translocase subunit Sec61beta
MAEKQQMRTPSGVAGLVRFEEAEDAIIKMKPIHVFGIAVALIVMELVLFLAIPL